MTVLQIMEEERAKGHPNWLVVGLIYDELFRRSLDERAKKRDAKLDLGTEVGEINKRLLEAAESRVDIVLQAASPSKRSRTEPPASLPSPGAAVEAQQRAVEGLQNFAERANEAARTMASAVGKAAKGDTGKGKTDKDRGSKR